MFFKHKGKIFGAPESSRIIFAKMKDKKDEDNTKKWRKEANFSAIDLQKYGQDEQGQSIFGEKELSDIKVIDKSDVEKSLC